MSELLPCPFCGGEPRLWNYSRRHKFNGYAITCKQGCSVQFECRDTTEAEAVKEWNTRPPSQPGREEVAIAWINGHCRARGITFEETNADIGKGSFLWNHALQEADRLLSLTKGTEPGAVTGEPVYCTRDGDDFCNAVSDKARCSICPAFPSRNSTDE